MLVMQCTVMLHFLGLTSIQCGHNYGLLGNYGQRCPSHILTLTLNIPSRYLSPTISYINNSITVFSSCGDRRYFCLLPCWDLVNTPSLIFFCMLQDHEHSVWAFPSSLVPLCTNGSLDDTDSGRDSYVAYLWRYLSQGWPLDGLAQSL